MTIADIVTGLAAAPRPVVCLDTCVVLDVLRAGWREPAAVLEAASRLVRAAVGPDPQVVAVVTALVRKEFDQNRGGVLRAQVAEVAEIILRTNRLVGAVGVVAPSFAMAPFAVPPDFGDELMWVAESLLDVALTLDRDPVCTDRALDRVTEKIRPAASGNVKDAIHLEHYLELSRAVAAAGLSCRRLFVSSNRADFDDPALKAGDFAPAGLDYFPRLEAALGALRI